MNRLCSIFLLAALLWGCHASLWAGRPSSDVSLEGATYKDSVYVEANAIYMGMRGRFVRAALGPPAEVDYAYGRKSRFSGGTQKWLYHLPMRCMNPNRCPDYAVAKVFISGGEVVGLRDVPGQFTGL